MDKNISHSDLNHFVEYNVRTNEMRTFYFSNNNQYFGVGIPTEAELAAIGLYEELLDYHVGILYHKIHDPIKWAIGTSEKSTDRRRYAGSIPTEVGEQIKNLIIENSNINSRDKALDHINGNGLPDLLVCDKQNNYDFYFVEVKGPSDSLQKSQIEWFSRFDYLPVKICNIFISKADQKRFIHKDSFNLNDDF